MVSHKWVANHLQVVYIELQPAWWTIYTHLLRFWEIPACHLGEAGTWCLLVFLRDLQNLQMHVWYTGYIGQFKCINVYICPYIRLYGPNMVLTIDSNFLQHASRGPPIVPPATQLPSARWVSGRFLGTLEDGWWQTVSRSNETNEWRNHPNVL